VLESILSQSHRNNIINLANTCREARSLLVDAVSKLRNPFPRCAGRLMTCTMCGRRVCEECGPETTEFEQQPSVMRAKGISQALICEGAPAAIAQMSITLKSRHSYHAYEYIPQKITHRRFCEVCFGIYEPRISAVRSARRHELMGQWAMHLEREVARMIASPDWHILPAMLLSMQDVPHVGNACTCRRFSTGCPITPHLVDVANIPAECELVGLVSMPEEWRRGSRDLHLTIPVYVMDNPAQREPA